jgi:hypothetical protein
VDYPNTAKVLKGIALGILTLANNTSEPRWNAQNEKAARYQKAWQERQR